METSMWLGR